MSTLIKKGPDRLWIEDEHLSAYEDAGWELLTTIEGPPLVYYNMAGGEVTANMALYREEKWAQAKILRDACDKGVADTPFGQVQVDDSSKLKISGLVQMAQIAKGAGAPFSEVFTMADNSQVTLDADQMIGLGIAVGEHVSRAHARGRQIRQAIQDAETLEELDAIDLSSGWPE